MSPRSRLDVADSALAPVPRRIGLPTAEHVPHRRDGRRISRCAAMLAMIRFQTVLNAGSGLVYREIRLPLVGKNIERPSFNGVARSAGALFGSLLRAGRRSFDDPFTPDMILVPPCRVHRYIGFVELHAFNIGVGGRSTASHALIGRSGRRLMIEDAVDTTERPAEEHHFLAVQAAVGGPSTAERHRVAGKMKPLINGKPLNRTVSLSVSVVDDLV